MPGYYQTMNPYGMYTNQLQYPQTSYQQPFSQISQPASSSSQGIIWVQGEAGAKSFMLSSPGQSVLLMDSESNTFYIKSSDNSGIPLPLRAFDYTERGSAQQSSSQEAHQMLDPNLFVTHEEFEKFKNEVLNRRKPQNEHNNKEN